MMTSMRSMPESISIDEAADKVAERVALPAVVVKILLNHGWAYVEELGRPTRFEQSMSYLDGEYGKDVRTT